MEHIGKMCRKNALPGLRNHGKEDTKKHACIIVSLSFSSVQNRRELGSRKVSVTLSGKMDTVVPGECFNGIIHILFSNPKSKTFHAPFSNT